LNSFRGLLLEDVHRLKIGMQELYDIKQEIWPSSVFLFLITYPTEILN
jgi:hypothetical protein